MACRAWPSGTAVDPPGATAASLVFVSGAVELRASCRERRKAAKFTAPGRNPLPSSTLCTFSSLPPDDGSHEQRTKCCLLTDIVPTPNRCESSESYLGCHPCYAVGVLTLTGLGKLMVRTRRQTQRLEGGPSRGWLYLRRPFEERFLTE